MPNQFKSADEVPVIETDRLLLRRHLPDDFAACARMWADPNVTRHIGGKPSSPQEVWMKLLRYAGLWAWLGYGYWAILEKSTGGFIGELGFADFKRDIDPPTNGIPELGWALATEAHGKGFATEALHAAIAWGDACLESRRTVCLIDPDNLPSIRVAQKCGYREFHKTTYKGEPTILFDRWVL
jgi:RimJ/RimL family protein N-acetyltransferase